MGKSSCYFVVSCLAALVLAQGGARAATLTNVARTGGQFQFTLAGGSNEIYVIQATTNLQDWTPVLTNSQFGAAREVLLPALSPQSCYRAVVARPLFNFAIAARTTIDLSGNNIRSDSFDSRDPNKSTAGLYDPLKAGDGGDLAAGSTLTNSVVVGNARIQGKVSFAPGGSCAVGPSGSVGSLAWHIGGNTGIQPGWASGDFAFEFPEGTAAYTVGSVPGPGVVAGRGFYDFALGNGDYIWGPLRLTNSTMIVVGHARLKS